MSRFTIYLNDVRIYAFIGVYEEERIVGNNFLINLSVDIDGEGFKEEDLDTSISYATLYDIVKEEMTKKVMLLETVAKRIADRILGIWESAQIVSIKIDKLNPPIPGIDGNCGVKYSAER